MILWSFLGFVLILWVANLQRDHMRERERRFERQRRQRAGLEPILGPNGQQDSLEFEEQRLLAILRERQGKAEGES